MRAAESFSALAGWTTNGRPAQRVEKTFRSISVSDRRLFRGRSCDSGWLSELVTARCGPKRWAERMLRASDVGRKVGNGCPAARAARAVRGAFRMAAEQQPLCESARRRVDDRSHPEPHRST